MTLTEEQIQKGFLACIGMEPRVADVAIVQQMGGTSEVLAEYIWDHWMGEPETPTAEKVQEYIEDLVNTKQI